MTDAIKVCKFHCETCKLSYASQSELQEHLWSLMHHVRLEQKEKPTEHVCCLCQTSTNNLVQYGQHLNELRHKQALTKLREKKISESTKPSILLSLKTTAPPFLLPNKSWHLNFPFSHLKPYISPLNGRKHLSQSYQSYPSGIFYGDQHQYPKVNPMRDGFPCSEERVGLNCNEKNTENGGGDKDMVTEDQLFLKTTSVKQNEIFSGQKKAIAKKRKNKKPKLDIQSNTSVNDQTLTVENWLPESGISFQNESVKDSNQNLSDSGSAPKSKKKMIVTTPSGFRQGLFLEDDFKKSKLDLVRLNLINATNDKGDRVFANKLLAGFMKDNNNIFQHSSLPHFQTKYFKSTKLITKSRSLKRPNLPKNLLKSPESSTAAQPLKDLSKTQPQTFLKVIPSKVTNPLETVKDSQNKPNTIDKNFTICSSQKETNLNDKTVNVQRENILPSPKTLNSTVKTTKNSKYSPNTSNTTVETTKNTLLSPNTPNNTLETTKNSKNSKICNTLSQSPENSGLKIKSPNYKESDPKTTQLLEAKSNSTSSIDFATSKPTSSQSETAISGLARKRGLGSDCMAGTGKPNPMKKLKCSTSKEINVSEKIHNLSLDAACNSSKKVDPTSNLSSVCNPHERSNHSEELTSAKPDSTVEKQQLSKNVGKEELVKMTKLSCLNHKEKMHLSSVMKSYTKTQNKRSAVPRLTMQLSGIYNTSNQEENSEKLNLPEGLEEQITMLIKKENLDEFGNTEALSSSDQLITETGQAALQMDLLPTTVSDTLNPLSTLTQPNFSSVSKKSLVSAGTKAKSKSSAVKSKTNAKSQSKNTLHTPPPSGASVSTPTTTTNTTISTTTTTTTTAAAAANNSQPLHIVKSPRVVDQNAMAEDTVESNSQAHDVFSKVYLLTLQEEEVCSNVSNINNRISYLEKLIEDSQIALQASKDEQLSLIEEEKKIRKMRIGILKEAMGDTNRSNSELISQLLRSHLTSERVLQNTSIPSLSSLSSNDQPFCTQQDGAIDQKIPLEVLQTRLMQFKPDSTAAQKMVRPAAVLENTGIQTITQQKQPTLAALLAKRNRSEPNFMMHKTPKHQRNCVTQGTQPPQSGSLTQQKPQQPSSVTQNKQQSGSVTQEKHHQRNSVALLKSPVNLLLPKDMVKSLKIPKALIASVFQNQKPLSNMQNPQERSQVDIFSQQVGTNTLQPPNVPNRIPSGKKEPKCSVFQFSQETSLISTKETNNISKCSKPLLFSLPSQEHSDFKAPSSVSSPFLSSIKISNSVFTNSNNNNMSVSTVASDSCDVPIKIMDSSKEMPETSQSLISMKKRDCGSCESAVKNISDEPTTIPLASSFNNVQIKMEPISPEATETKSPVSGSIFNFPSIKEEPKSPTELGESRVVDESMQDSLSALSHTDNPQKVHSIKEGQPQLFLPKNVGDVTSKPGNPVSPESRCVNSSNSNIGSDELSSEQNLQTDKSEQSSNLSITLPVDESGQICIKEEPLSPVPETSTTCRVQQSSPPSLQSSAASNHPMEPSSLPADSKDKQKPNEELEFFSSLSVKNLLDSSRIESLPENVDPEKSSGKVSMKYLGSMSNNLVEQLKECWKKQNVTMNKCFPQGQSDDAAVAANIPNVLLTSTCETSTKSENNSTLPHATPPYTMNIEKSNKFVLPANLNPVVSIEPLSLSPKYNSSSGLKYVETVDVKPAKSNSKFSKATCNSSEMLSNELPTDDSSNKVIVIDGNSSSEDIDTVNTINKLSTCTTPQKIYINSDSEDFSKDTLQKEFSTESHGKDSNFMSNTNSVYKGPNCPVTSCTIYGNYLYASYQGHSPQKFDLKTRVCVKQYDCQQFSVQCMLVTGFLIEKPRLFSGGASEMLLAFNEITGVLLTKIDLMRKIYTFHEKWNSLYVGLADGGVSKINLKTLKETSNISYGTKPIHCLATCTEGALRILCVGAYDASILIVDASSGLLLKTLLPCQRLLYSIKVSQNLIYSCSEDKKLAVYDIESGKLLKCIQGHSGTVSCLYVDNKILVTGSHDKLINVYWGTVTELGKMQPLSFYGADKQSISCLTVSDRKIFSGNFYGTIEALNISSEISTKKWPCRYNKCMLVFGLHKDLRYHVHSEHLKGQIAKRNNWQCQWIFCSETFNSLSLLTTHCDRHFNQ